MDRGTNNIFFKAIIHNILDGRDVGTSVYTEDYLSLNDAIKDAGEHTLSPLSIIEVREYDASEGATIAVGDPSLDTGREVYRDISGIHNALKEEYKRLKEDDTFEGTMSALIEGIKSYSESYLYDAVGKLRDNEINKLLEEYGDSDYTVCVNGEIIAKENIEERE